jgi:fibronectin type 3 domain-containing protein
MRSICFLSRQSLDRPRADFDPALHPSPRQGTHLNLNRNAPGNRMRRHEIVNLLRFSLMALVTLLAGIGSASGQNSTIFGPNVYVFTPSDSAATINSDLNQLNANAQFSTNRYAVLFAPGTYTGVEAEVGYYESVAGLGTTPSAVHISNGYLTSNQTDSNGNITTNFWRSLENMQITAPAGDTLQWGVSQGSPFRRMYVDGASGLELANTNCGYASGGFISNSLISGAINACSQQQWYTRNSSIGSFTGYVWNFVFSGVSGAPAQSNPFGTGSSAYTTLATTPVSREKPFLYMDGSGNYWVFSPAPQTNSAGTTWSGGGVGSGEAGTSLPISSFLIATPSTSLDAINNALASGQNLILTPGIYQYNGSINVTNPNTVVLGLGYADLIPQSGTAAMTVADVDGVQIAGLLVDAGPVNSPVLLQIGVPGAVRASHQANPITISDVFVRIGGATAGTATESVEVDSDNVILDDMWLWRADHGTDAAWTGNTAANGLVVNGDNVTALGLAVEHYQQTQVEWNGNGGETIFYQSELPYDPPSQAAWMDGSVDGYPSYSVASNVLTHQAYGLGVYSYFDQGVDIVEASAISVPLTPGVSVNDAVTVFLNGSGSITNVVNNVGASVQTGANPSDVTYYGDSPCTANCPVTPLAPTGLTAAAISPSQINLSWSSSATPGVLYNVYGSANAGFTPNASTELGAGISATSFAATNLTPSTTYYFAVEANNTAGTSAPSAQAYATTLSASSCTAAPTTPIVPQVEDTSSSQNSVTWGASSAPSNCAVTYTLYRSQSPTGPPTSGAQLAAGLTQTSYTDSGLTNPTSYSYALVAVDSFGASAPTAWVATTSLSNWTQVWWDDFVGPAGTYPSSANWTPDVVNNTGQNPFGDGTIMSTTASPQNAYLDGNGDLVIAMTYNSTNNTYDSARLVSASPVGPYGRIDARIMNPFAQGMGAAFWALGSDYWHGTPWPESGELDIMESQSLNPSYTASTVHGFETDPSTYYEYTGLSEGVTLPNNEQLQQAFHTYTVLWAPYHFEYFLDGVLYGDAQLNDLGSTDVWEMNEPINFILSSGVGGNGGTPNGTGFPANLTFNYVRYYQWAGGAPSAVTGLTAVANYSNAVNLSWEASATPNVTYDIYASTTPGTAPSVNTLVAQQVTGTSYQHTGLQPNTTYYYTVVAADWGGESSASNATVTTRAPGNSTGMQLSAGGYSVGTYMASAFVVGGNTNYHLNNAINTAQVTNPAPQKVYDTERWGPSAWTITGLNPNGGYNVRLHFVEQVHTGPGQRQFNVSINSETVLSNFDIYATAGAANTAVTQEFYTTADENGIIELQTNLGTSGVTDENPTINAIEIIPATGSDGVGAAPGTTPTLSIASGGPAVSNSGGGDNSFLADEDYNGGDTATTANTISTAGVANAAPAAVYQSQRYVPFTYILTGLVADASYTVRMHFAETYWTAAGQRLFNVSINGNPVLTNLDVFAQAGANTALVEQFPANADKYGEIVVQLLAGKADNPFINGIEALQLSAPIAAPSGLTAQASGSSVNLAWTASSTSGVTYTVYRAIQGSTPAILVSGISGATYTDNSVAGSTTYVYYVVATNGSGTSPQSNWATATSNATSTCSAAPSAPGSSSATAASASQISLVWGAGSAGSACSVSYNVFRSTTSGFVPSASNEVAAGLTATAFGDSGLASSTTYFYLIEATDTAGSSAPSPQAAATTLAQACSAVPAAPGGLSATASSASAIGLSWTAVTAPANCTIASYSVYGSTTSGFTPSPATLLAGSLTGTTYSNTGLPPSTTYYYVVEANDTAGNSAPSTQAAATTAGNNADLVAIAAGGPAQSNSSGGDNAFAADEDYNGGQDNAVSNATINLTQPGANAAPMGVYQHARNLASTYTIPGLTPGQQYTVLLHFAETYFTTAGARQFNVAINGTTVLTNLDIYATVGANAALVETFPATANSSGEIVIAFTLGAVNQPVISGIEVR